jgi:DNA-binding CsgD family transcriptional regulator
MLFQKGFRQCLYMVMFYDELIASALKKPKTPLIEFKSREEEFLKYLCYDLSYKQIAENMNISPRTIDGYRDNLFLKFEVINKSGLVVKAIKLGLV